MLKTLLISCFLFLIVGVAASQTSSSCSYSSAFNNTYEEDVQELAIIDMLASNSADTGSIGVIPSYSQDVFRAMAAVANTASPSNEADSIFNLYCIHHEIGIDGYNSDQLYVRLNSSVPWTSNWLNLSIPSGNTVIDNLLAGQTYTISKPFPSFIPELVLLNFNDRVNIKPIIQQLTGMNGIVYAEGNPFIGDGNYIAHSKVGNTSYLDFSIGWDDCSSGCISRRVWSYSVDLLTCSVTYLGATGASLSSFNNSPAYQPNCNILLSNAALPSAATNIQVYPNPSRDVLHVEGAVEQVQLYNTVGTLLLQTHTATELESLDISHLPKGVYVLVVNEAVRQLVVKE